MGVAHTACTVFPCSYFCPVLLSIQYWSCVNWQLFCCDCLIVTQCWIPHNTVLLSSWTVSCVQISTLSSHSSWHGQRKKEWKDKLPSGASNLGPENSYSSFCAGSMLQTEVCFLPLPALARMIAYPHHQVTKPRHQPCKCVIEVSHLIAQMKAL